MAGDRDVFARITLTPTAQPPAVVYVGAPSALGYDESSPAGRRSERARERERTAAQRADAPLREQLARVATAWRVVQSGVAPPPGCVPSGSDRADAQRVGRLVSAERARAIAEALAASRPLPPSAAAELDPDDLTDPLLAKVHADLAGENATDAQRNALRDALVAELAHDGPLIRLLRTDTVVRARALAAHGAARATFEPGAFAGVLFVVDTREERVVCSAPVTASLPSGTVHLDNHENADGLLARYFRGAIQASVARATPGPVPTPSPR